MSGLNFCQPPSTVKREEVFAEFEVLVALLQHHTQPTADKDAALLAKLSDLAHAYCSSPIDIGGFLIKKSAFRLSSHCDPMMTSLLRSLTKDLAPSF